ncbi:hypothetical protein GCM10018980_50300 [Streptomyces capoamus]|uniref:Uncharacterized protein n=1 Tax=Streptomyces capoamus TaxID=68183 RepID=A0A919EYZ8_9ACTN|nr:hypothetical protein [Streptomyces capoamus]GGW10716.1 hypothetical protein GCM10010501_06400 [Streptomyces libani subsp. rufus]GHG61172.1 hypothetical protein GCM10018980_50300 [Streptomyces capoamus]
MHSNDDVGRPAGDLSTEDLAQPANTGADAEPEGAPSGAPVYPGESTGTPGAAEQSTDDTAAGGDAGAGPDAGETAEAPAATAAEDDAPQLLTDDEERTFRDRWQAIQNRFVDDPREAVHDADALVADVMQTLASTFAQHKKDLEGQWAEGEKVDTEELRGALRRYRSFFNRLLST